MTTPEAKDGEHWLVHDVRNKRRTVAMARVAGIRWKSWLIIGDDAEWDWGLFIPITPLNLAALHSAHLRGELP